MNNTRKRPIENSDGFPFTKRSRFGSPNSSYQNKNNFQSRGSFRGRGQFNRDRGGFNRSRGGFNRGRGGFNRGRGGFFQSFNSPRGAGPVQNYRESSNCLKVCFPDSEDSVKSALSEVFKNCDRVTGPRNLVTYWDPQNLIEKLPLLRKIKVDDELLNFNVTSLSESKNKRNVFIPRKHSSNKENIVKFFNASSISDKPFMGSFVLTFPSSAAASKAAKKVMVTDSSFISLKPHYEENVFLSNIDDDENVKKLEESLKTLAKGVKTKSEKVSMEVEEKGSEDEESKEDTDDDDEGEEEEEEEDEEQEGDDNEEEEEDDEGEEEEDDDDDEDDDDE